jgi:hypothetical protein
MSTADDERTLREEIARLLRGTESEIRTSGLGRLARTALSAVRERRPTQARRRRGQPGGAREAGRLGRRAQGDRDEGRSAPELRRGSDSIPGQERALGPSDPEPPMPFSRLSEVVRTDLEDEGAPLLAGMDRTPVSAASIGQVHRARLPDGRLVAVKVRYPDIERAIAVDFRQAALGGRIAALVYPGSTGRADDSGGAGPVPGRVRRRSRSANADTVRRALPGAPHDRRPAGLPGILLQARSHECLGRRARVRDIPRLQPTSGPARPHRRGLLRVLRSPGAVVRPGRVSNAAACVCSGVRVALSILPSDLTSL